MANLALTDLADILMENYGALITENVTQRGPGNSLVPEKSFMGRLQAHGNIFIGGADGNDLYAREWGVHAGTAAAASYGPSDPLPAATQETWDDASIGWKRVWIAMEWDNLVRLQTRMATRGGRDSTGIDFMKKLKALIHKIEVMLATDGTGNSSKDFTGFLAALSASNTYATIAQGANGYWQASVLAAGGASLSLATHMEVMATVLSQTRDVITPGYEIWMSRAQWLKFKVLYEDNLRYQPGMVAGTAIAPRYQDGDVDLPIYVLPLVPATEVWWLPVDEIELRFLDHTPADELSNIANEEVFHENVPVGLSQEPTGRDSKGIVARMYGNLVIQNPYKCGIISGLA